MNKQRIYTLAVCALALSFGAYRRYAAENGPTAISHEMSQPANSVAPLSRALHPAYPYSVVAGGVYSPAELRYAVAHDRVVREHYAGFQVDSARLVTLTRDRMQYVSYRRGDHVFWTSRKLRIPKGEVLLTDGQNYARTRCGNRLCVNLQGHTDPKEPAAALLSMPDARPETLAVGPLKVTGGPVAGELAQEADTVPITEPRLKSVTAAEGNANPWGVNSIGPAGYTPGVGFWGGAPVGAASGTPAGHGSNPGTPGGGSPGTPTGIPAPPPVGVPPVLTAVPEPKGLPVIVVMFSISLIGLLRVARRGGTFFN